MITEQLFQNSVLITTLAAWAISCILKGGIYFALNRTLPLNRIFGSGGMPSSHSATVVSMAASVGLAEGFGSSVFAVSLVLAFVVMYDAAGVRRAAGQHAFQINAIMDMLAEPDSEARINKLKEILGHTPAEVGAGALLGLIVAAIAYYGGFFGI